MITSWELGHVYSYLGEAITYLYKTKALKAIGHDYSSINTEW